MSTAITTGIQRRSQPGLRLLRDECAPRAPLERTHHGTPAGTDAGADTAPTAPTSAGASVWPRVAHEERPHVLVAGADSVARATMLEQLRGLFPEGTPFAQAGETWEVVAQASDSRMVVLTGDLGDLSARGLMRVLSRRHPLLPVIALKDRTDGAAPAIGAASL